MNQKSIFGQIWCWIKGQIWKQSNVNVQRNEIKKSANNQIYKFKFERKMSTKPINNKEEQASTVQKQNGCAQNKIDENEETLLSEQEQIEELESEISRKLEQMRHFKEQMKRRRVEKQIQQKEEENPFVVKQTYVDRQLKKLNAKSDDLMITNPGQQDEQEMQRKVQEILKKINL